MRYHAVCAPEFKQQYFAEGLTRAALRQAPCVCFNRKDALQARFIRRVARTELEVPQHWIPHMAGFLRACETGLGWGMCPERLIGRQLAEGSLVELAPGRGVDVELYWQSWRLSIGWLDRFSSALRSRAATLLE